MRAISKGGGRRAGWPVRLAGITPTKGITMCKSVEQTIYEMLIENTGSHFLDSGGAYGRNHEKNQGVTLEQFKAQPTVVWSPRWQEYEIPVFPFLTRRLSLNETCREFNERFVPAANWGSEEYYGVSNEGTDWLREKGFNRGDSFNTYNGTTFLSQVLQGSILSMPDDEEYDEEKYCLLQIHGGCDVRGGYTDARLFVVDRFALFTETVYGTVTKKDGTVHQVSNNYDGYSLRDDESDEEVDITEDDEVQLFCEY